MYFMLEDEGGVYCVTGYMLESQSRQSAKLFLQSSEWDSPTPSQASVAPPLWSREKEHTGFQERGWGAQFGRGDRLWYSRYIYGLCGIQ
jgi:hypothetical protein